MSTTYLNGVAILSVTDDGAMSVPDGFVGHGPMNNMFFKKPSELDGIIPKSNGKAKTGHKRNPKV